MNAKNDTLDVGDLFKIYGRKFLRMAPAYYSIWLFLYIITPRIIRGQNAWVAENNMYNCET